MDLIFANSQLEDIGVVQDFILDMAYGQTTNAENNFEIKMELQKPMCEAGDYLYIEGTEYGGIVDAIGADTKDNYLTFSGRTWHGILDSKIIEPYDGMDYYAVSGDANNVVRDLIEHCGLDDIFEVSNESSGIDIEYFDFKYTDNDDKVYLNIGLFKMLYQFDAKLKIVCERGKVKLHVERLMNYATDEFDSSQMKFSLTKVFNHVNHLVCIGKEADGVFPIIHLFADINGGVQQYLVNPANDPLEDSDYVLDKRYQVLTGLDERTELCDYPESGVVENYKLLSTKPADWDENYFNYYEKKAAEGEEQEESYTLIERNIHEVYNLTTSKPADWDDTYMEYYTRSYNEDTGEDVYTKVDEVMSYNYTVIHQKPNEWNEIYTRYFVRSDDDDDYKPAEKVPVYKKVNKQPKDWKKGYDNYYTFDGTSYHQVSGKPKNHYSYQTAKPSTWETDWKTADWYIKRKNSNGKAHYVKLGDDRTLSRIKTHPKWKKNTYYNRGSKTVTPDFKELGQVYSVKMKIPTWADNTYYTREKVPGTPRSWEAYVYYRRADDVDLLVDFVANTFYEKVLDHYAKIVEKAIEVLGDFNDRDDLSINFEEDANMYDIGDVVGGTENITGLRVAQPIVKKIINIENNIVKIQHLIREVKEWA